MATRHDPRALTVAQHLQARVAPAEVILFGSRARGDWHAASDIDLMVVADRLTDAQRLEYSQLGWRVLKPETAHLYPEPVDVQVFAMEAEEFNWARRARMHLAGAAQHDGLTARGERVRPIEQNDPWPSVQNLLQRCHKALFHALRAEGDGNGATSVLQAHDALQKVLKAHVSALGRTFRKTHDLKRLITTVEGVEQCVDFSHLTDAWCDALGEYRRYGPYEFGRPLFEPSAHTVNLVQATCGAVAARVLAIVERKPGDVEYHYSERERYPPFDPDRPLGGLEDLRPAAVSTDSVLAAERRRALLGVARRLFEHPRQVDDLRDHLDRNPRAAWPSVVDLIDGRRPPFGGNGDRRDADQLKPPRGW